MYTAQSEYAPQLGFLLQLRHMAICLIMLHSTCFLVNSLHGWARETVHGPKGSPYFWLDLATHLLLKHYERLVYQQACEYEQMGG